MKISAPNECRHCNRVIDSFEIPDLLADTILLLSK